MCNWNTAFTCHTQKYNVINTNPPIKSKIVENDSKKNSNNTKTETQHDFSEQITDVKMEKALEENDFEPNNACLENRKPKKKQWVLIH